MDAEDFFIKKTKIIFSNETIKKLNTIIKENVIVIPFIYIIGTIMLLIRNATFGLPFAPISIIQFAIIIVYLVIALVFYALINSMLVNIISEIKSNNLLKSKVKSIIGLMLILALLLGTIIMIFSLILEFNIETFKILLCYYIMLPVMLCLLFRNTNIPLLNYSLIILFYMTIVLHIPISIGGFKGQKVYFYNDTQNSKTEYTFYGITDGMYQFSDNETIYLIPIDKGYIEYKK